MPTITNPGKERHAHAPRTARADVVPETTGQRVLWFLGLYFAGLVTTVGAVYALRALLFW